MNTTALKLSALLKNAVVDAKGKHIGALADIIVQPSPGSTPRLTGLVLRLGSRTVYAPAAKILAMNADRIDLASAKLDLRPFERRRGEVLLRADVLGHRMIDIKNAAMVRAYDVQLESTADGWVATGLDTHHRSWFGLDRNPEQHTMRRWDEFESKPEADVFEELDDDNQPRMAASRSNDQAAAVLGRMRPDDAAGGLMGLDFVQFPPDTTVGLALTAVSRSTAVQLEALTVLFSVDAEGRLVGSLSLAQALQLPSETLLLHACAPDPVFAMPEDDVIDVANKMADFNLLMLPVLDPEGRIQGVITVDDALEAAIPEDWRRRGPRTRPGV